MSGLQPTIRVPPAPSRKAHNAHQHPTVHPGACARAPCGVGARALRARARARVCALSYVLVSVCFVSASSFVLPKSLPDGISDRGLGENKPPPKAHTREWETSPPFPPHAAPVSPTSPGLPAAASGSRVRAYMNIQGWLSCRGARGARNPKPTRLAKVRGPSQIP